MLIVIGSLRHLIYVRDNLVETCFQRAQKTFDAHESRYSALSKVKQTSMDGTAGQCGVNNAVNDANNGNK